MEAKTLQETDILDEYLRLVRKNEHRRIVLGYNMSDLARRLNVDRTTVQKALHPQGMIAVLKRIERLLDGPPEPRFVPTTTWDKA